MWPRTCDRAGCDTAFTPTVPSRARYCSMDCARKVRDAEHAYDIEIPCPVCGNLFWQRKYRGTPATCGSSCGQVHRRRQGR